ncbi:MAG: transcriptional regulator [Cyanobacteria bacterium]|jgi:HTH-type transcriptional regulator/antitoxin HigA|nr:transcriptional regulator [Cyanobacteria bacterium GSL.Bin1]
MTPTTDPDTTYIPISILPFVIETEEQYNKALSISESLFFKKSRTEAEEQAFDVWMVLIEMYENQTFTPGQNSTPVSVLKTLMEAKGVSQADLEKEGVGSSGVISEIVNGKRGISKQQAKRLAEIFI